MVSASFAAIRGLLFLKLLYREVVESDFNRQVLTDPIVVGTVVERDVVAELFQREIADSRSDSTTAIGHTFVAGAYARRIEQLFQPIVRREKTLCGDQFAPYDILRAWNVTRLTVHIPLALEFFDAAEID